MSARSAGQRLAGLHVEGRGRSDDEARDAVRAHDRGGRRARGRARELRALGRRSDHEVDVLRVGRVRRGPDLQAEGRGHRTGVGRVAGDGRGGGGRASAAGGAGRAGARAGGRGEAGVVAERAGGAH